MRVSVRLLRELCPALTASPTQIGERLSALGLEVEREHTFGQGAAAVVVAEVRKIEPHPSREKLRLVTVFTGTAEQRVVCGAANVPDPGGLVLLAPLGSKLPEANLVIEPRAIGGVESAGMLCSESELGLAEESDGIVVLAPGAAKPGSRYTDLVPTAHDTLFEIGVTPNRPDALGHVGVARDLAASFGVPFTLPNGARPARESDLRLESLLSVEVKEPERCPFYGAAIVDDVQIGPSPAWLRYRLQALGIRPISNVVDVTNLLLLEYGQPLHAFDYALVRGAKIVVRRAAEGEPFSTLDGVARKLSADDLVICDAEGPSALAGVMGGKDSEIRSTTRRVLLESAYFQPRGIRRTSRRHGLSTESSHRFERGVDSAAPPAVLERAKALLVELAGGTAVPGAIHVKAPEAKRPRVTLRSRRLDAILGAEVPFGEARDALVRLGFGVSEVRSTEAGPVVDVEAASFRPDVTREIDLIEEVFRLRGFDRIPTVLPSILPQPPRTCGKLERDTIREASNLGLSEAVTYSFVSEKELAAVHAPPPVVTLQNPLSEDRRVMRTSLLPGLLDVVKRARRRGERDARLFGVGARFLAPGDASASAARPRQPEDRVLPEERPSFAAVLAGARPGHLGKPEEQDVFDAKGLAVELVERLTGRTPHVVAARGDARPAHLHPRGAALVSVEGTHVGTFGPLHPDVVDALDVGGPVQVVELDLAAVESVGNPTPKYRPIPRLPGTARDVAVIVREDLPAADVERAILAAAGELCESVELFDVFSGKSIGDGARSLAYRVVYRDPKASTDPDHARTLTDDEVERHHERVRAAVKQLGELRE
ncbi:MAG TPA: phenylalanine--tRNA ligase subunit beta [Polyangiaceae bacterium]|nr:phenylalanine--tRNA ligase subunit beta [Polyangiaceae bacterium]